MNKIILSVILCLVIALSFCSCSLKKNDNTMTTTESALTVPAEETTTEPVTTESEETTTEPTYDTSLYEGLSDEEIGLIIGTFGEDFKFEGIDELSSKEISKLLKYARSVGKRVKIRNSRLVITDVEGGTTATTVQAAEKVTETTTKRVTETTTKKSAETTTGKAAETTTKKAAEENAVTTTLPDNILPAILPKPDFGNITLHSGNDKEYAITVTNFTESNIEDYINRLTAAGFNQGIEQINDLDNGVYSYSASTPTGATVNISVITENSLVITVKLPE